MRTALGILDDYPSLPATSEVDDQYLNVYIMLKRVIIKARGRVTKQARDNDSNPMENANPNPILYSRKYVV